MKFERFRDVASVKRCISAVIMMPIALDGSIFVEISFAEVSGQIREVLAVKYFHYQWPMSQLLIGNLGCVKSLLQFCSF